MRNCPFCNNEIQDAAIKCRYCKQMLKTKQAITTLTDSRIGEFQRVCSRYAKNIRLEANNLSNKFPLSGPEIVLYVVLLIPFWWLLIFIVPVRYFCKRNDINFQRTQLLAIAAKLEHVDLDDTRPDSIVLKKDEFLLFEEPTQLSEVQTEYNTVALSGGAARSLGSNYIMGAMATVGKSIPSHVKRKLDSGTLTLTTKRLIFNGQAFTRCDHISDILATTPFADGIAVNSTANKKTQFYHVNENAVLLIVFIRALQESFMAE